MSIVGIIAEYNPFHNGHLYHIETAKKITNADHVIVVMSGNYVQRGTPAVIDKYNRTKMALQAGADIVIELPVIFSTASAEFFASGGVSILNALGCVDYLCFGSECGDTASLSFIAELLINESTEFKNFLKQYLKQGLSYPAARWKAVKDCFLNQAFSDTELLKSPNNILGIEYIKALNILSSPIQPVTVSRKETNYHDTQIHGTLCSASALRMQYNKSNDLQIFENTVPSYVREILSSCQNKAFPVEADDFSQLLYYKLASCNSYDTFADVSKDLALRISKTYDYTEHFSQLASKVKTKQMTLSRIQRSLLHILLDIKKEHMLKYAPYARILGMRRNSSFLLKKSNHSTEIPLITKVASAKRILSKENYEIFKKDLFATHLYNQVLYEKFQYKIPDEYHHGIILEN